MPDCSALVNRLRRRQRVLRRWARRQDISCWRIYDRDIGEWPAVVDWYDGHAVLWTLRRTRDDSDEADRATVAAVTAAVAEALDLPLDRVHAKRRARQRGTCQYSRLDCAAVSLPVQEHGLRFTVNLSDYLDVGLFLDHRPARRMIRDLAAGRDVLNLFAYTGSFSVYAAAGGARSTHSVDLSATYCSWAESNLAANGFTPPAHRVQRADCLRWLENATRPAYDLIILDPPSFSNSTTMAGRNCAIDRDHPWLLWRCWNLLRPGGLLLFSCNLSGFRLASQGLPPFAIDDITAATTDPDCARRPAHQAWLCRRE